MEHHNRITDHPKRRRRRRADRCPISGWLVPSEHFEGNVGRISQDFFADLFCHDIEPDRTGPNILYLAVTPWSPLSQDPVEDATWIILPVEVQGHTDEETDKLGPSSIHFPAKSPAFEPFADALLGSLLAKRNAKGETCFEIRVLDVKPLELRTIYVTVDGTSLDKHEEVQKQFGGGFGNTRTNGSASKGKGKEAAGIPPHSGVNGDRVRSQIREREDRLTLAVRDALASTIVVRQNGILPLPLPTHPITHVPLPPAKISLCEPVSQGLLSKDTKIVINIMFHANSLSQAPPSAVARKALYSRDLGDGYDTSNEQFFSAAENGVNEDTAQYETSNSGSDSDSSDKDSDDSSDDSMHNMISMNVSRLLTKSSGILSSRNAATPHVGGPRTNGISTPGSVFSNVTAATARQAYNANGRILRARGLMSSIPDELLFPKPVADEDEEARVMVDVKTLLKLGCFSGDWMQLEAASAPISHRSGAWGSDAFSVDDSRDESRPVKVYGLPDLGQTTRYLKGSTKGRKSSISTLPSQDASGSAAWLSPILMANLGNLSHVRLTPLLANTQENGSPKIAVKRTKISTSASPPVAKELTIVRISTPLSTERPLQIGIFTALKQYFEKKRRILRQGDLIALRIDTRASRMLTQPSSVPDVESEVEELLSHALDPGSSTTIDVGIAWFRVGQVTTSEPDITSGTIPADVWGGATCIEPTITRMRQAGSVPSRIPSSADNSWQYYLGVRPPVKAPLPQVNTTGQYVIPMPQHYIVPLRRRLRELLAAATSPRASHLRMDPLIILLHSTQRSIGKAALASGAASDLGLHVFDIDAYDILAEGGSAGDVKTEALFKARVERALSCGPSCTALLVRHIEAISANRMVAALKEVVSDIRVLIATTTELKNIPDEARSLFSHELEVSAPDEGEREGTLRGIIEDRAIRLAHDVDLASIAVKSAALVAGDLVDIIERALVARQDRLEQLVSGSSSDSDTEQILVRDVLISGGEYARCMIKADLEIAVEAARKNFADAIGAPKIPNVSWDDVGGLENVKDAVMETIQLPLERPDLFAKGMKKRSGILFYGPPGTGKTLLAKAIATEFSLNFFSIKGPELLNMYIGESEANVRRVFQRARDARPCVVFFDELDSVAPKRGNQGDSGGVMDRIVSQLLAELDGMSDGDEGAGGVFVIGATNRPDLLDQALLRPGRFDKMLYLGISDTHKKQQTILEALTRKFTMHPKVSLHRVAESLPFTYTGADLYALCSDAMLKAITRQASAVDAKIKALPGGLVTTAYFFDHLATKEDIAVMVTELDFFAAQRELVGSVR